MTGRNMKTLSRIFIMFMLIAIYHNAWASDGRKDDTPVIKALQSGKKTKRLEGAALKIARPILKKTPISAIIDDIDMMIICPVEKNDKLEGGKFTGRINDALKSYLLAHEINDELSHMLIYIDQVKGNRFNELVLYVTRPDPAIMYFRGSFTVESLMKVGELSEQDRKRRIQDKRENGKEDSYLQYAR